MTGQWNGRLQRGAARTQLAELDYDEIFQTLSKDRQEEILEKKRYFITLCKDAFG